MAYPHFTDPFTVSMDVSDKAIGGVLSQLRDGHERVIAYWSRQLSKADRNYILYQWAAVGTIKKFYPYLYGFHFTLIADHNPLTSLKDIKDTGGYLVHWLLFLQQFNFTVVYKKGSWRSNADTLLWRPPDNAKVTKIEACTFLTDTAGIFPDNKFREKMDWILILDSASHRFPVILRVPCPHTIQLQE